MGAIPMVRSLLLTGLLATAASAQSIALKYSFQDGAEYRFNASSCNAEITVGWTSTLTALSLCPNTELKLWSTELECGDTASLTDVRYPSVPYAQLIAAGGTYAVKLAELPSFRFGDGGLVCGTEGTEKLHKLCGSVQVSSGLPGAACTVSQAKSLSLVYDTKPPDVPTIIAVAELDSALKVEFSAPTGSVVHLQSKAKGEVEFTNRASLAASAGAFLKIPDLRNGTTYEVRAQAEDTASNFSAWSEPVSATPRKTTGFWGAYRDDGGAQVGGCTAVHGLPLLLAGGLWLLRRKKRSR